MDIYKCQLRVLKLTMPKGLTEALLAQIVSECHKYKMTNKYFSLETLTVPIADERGFPQQIHCITPPKAPPPVIANGATKT